MTLTIGQVAAAAAVNIQTIRYYERRGPCAAPRRTPAGYRQYAEDAVSRLRFIKHAQELGFSLKEIRRRFESGMVPRATPSSGRRGRRSRSSNARSGTWSESDSPLRAPPIGHQPP